MTADVHAGREVDRRVAEIVGDVHRDDGWWVSTDGSKIDMADGGPRPYSTNWNDAMRAAETTDLWMKFGAVLACRKEWCVFELIWNTIYASAPTGPLAICLAIIKTSERNYQDERARLHERQ